MANKKAKKRPADSGDNVVRIKAGAPSAKKPAREPREATVITSTATAKEAVKGKAVKAKKVKKPRNKRAITKPLRASGGYFKGAWTELRQVRWPTRRATWSMSLAVLGYSAFFIVIILLLDAGFQYLFDLIIK